jgi:hypothetical protein
LNLFSYNIYTSTSVEPVRIIINEKLNSITTGVINVVNSQNEQMLLQAHLFVFYFRGVKNNGGITTYDMGHYNHL